MLITAVIGSPHRNGNTAILAREVLRGAAESGAVVKELFLPDYRIEYCRGCLGNMDLFCMSTGRCVINDDVQDLKEIFIISDGIIFASPSYGVKPTAMMKNFITDRIGLTFAYTSALAGKYFVGVSTCGGIGAKQVARELAFSYCVGFHGNGFVTGYLGVKVGYNQITAYPGELRKAYQLGKKVVRDIKARRSYPLQKLFEKMLMKVVVRKIILKNISQNRDGIMKAVYDDLVKRNLLK